MAIDMRCVFVLGMHGSGTSLVSRMLYMAGVNMRPSKNLIIKNYMNYENVEWLKLNAYIMSKAGGDWAHPPRYDRLQALRYDAETCFRVKNLVTTYDNENLWGAKDCRFCLTMPIIHPYLPCPKYILLLRSALGCARSIMSRGVSSKSQGEWEHMTDWYMHSATGFLTSVTSPHLIVDYDALVRTRSACLETLTHMLDFVDVDVEVDDLVRIANVVRVKQ